MTRKTFLRRFARGVITSAIVLLVFSIASKDGPHFYRASAIAAVSGVICLLISLRLSDGER